MRGLADALAAEASGREDVAGLWVGGFNVPPGTGGGRIDGITTRAPQALHSSVPMSCPTGTDSALPHCEHLIRCGIGEFHQPRFASIAIPSTPPILAIYAGEGYRSRECHS